MIELLSFLTVAYALVLVGVLAATLIAILYYLRRIGNSLEKVGKSLTTVEGQTEPLAKKLDGLNAGLGAIGAGLGTAAGHLAASDELLADTLGEVEPASRVA